MISYLSAIIVCGIVIFISINYLSNQSNEIDKTPFRDAWKIITEKARHEETWEIAIINSDKLLDAALRKKGYKGATMGERLINAKNSLSNKNAVWEAHKLRNRLVHEQHVKLSGPKVYESLKGFETALKDLGAL